jgi:TolB-like protein
VVAETLAGRADQLGEYAIGLAVFDREEDYDPALDPIVRNDARRLRLKLLEYYRCLKDPPPDQVVIEIPKGGYVPVFRAVSCHEVELPAVRIRLAVLPFQAISVTRESEIHGRALGMSMTAGLTDVDGIETVAHGYSGDQPIRAAAAELRLTHLITGSLFYSEGRCHIIVNLIHAHEGIQLWARQYQFSAQEILKMQFEISCDVVQEVSRRLGLCRPQPVSLSIAA